MHTPSHTNVCKILIFQFSTYIFSADITPEMLKLCRVTKVKVFFLVLVYVFNFGLFEFSATILEKGLLSNKVYTKGVEGTVIDVNLHGSMFGISRPKFHTGKAFPDPVLHMLSHTYIVTYIISQ